MPSDLELCLGGDDAACARLAGGDDTSGKVDLSGLTGRTVMDAYTGYIGVMQPVYSPMTKKLLGYRLLSAPGQPAQKVDIGSLLIDPITRLSYQIGTGGAATSTKLAEGDLERLLGGSGGGSAPAYSSTRQAAQEAMAFEREQTAASQKFQMEQSALDRTAQERINRLRDLNDLIQQAMGNQQSAREMKFGLRNDSFALAGAFGAGLQGTTPVQAFSNQLGNYANAPLPQQTANMQLPQIEQAIKQVPGAVPMGGGFGIPPIPQSGGMAQGGSMTPSGPDFSPPGYSVIVGEGALNGDEEVVTMLKDGSVLVTPLKGGAATGATLPTASSSFGALSPMFGPLGFTSIPTYKSYGEGGGYSINPAQTTVGQRGPIDIMNRLGYQPSLVKQAGTTAIYYRDPTTGTLRHIANPNVFNQSGFSWNDVQILQPQDFARLGAIGPQLTSAPQQVNDRGAYGPANVPFLTPFGQVLANPFNIGAELQDAYLNDPIAWSNYVSSYANARGPAGEALGISPDQLLAMARAPFPTGTPRTVLGYR